MKESLRNLELNRQYNTIESNINTEGVQKSSISQKNIQHIIDILRNRIYSDKILAIIREISTNSYDAHVEAGIKDTPITVCLPTSLNPELIISDNGTGIGPENIHVFTSYGESTKRESNETIGALGLGCKSPLCYTDSFTVEDRYKGIKYIYNYYIDETGLGEFPLISESKTDEPSGVTIKVPIKNEDISDFTKKAKGFFKYWKVKPNVDCLNTKEYIEKINKKISFNNNCYILRSDSFDLYSINGRTEVIILMGNVPYRYTFKLSEYKQLSSLLTNDIYSYLVIEVPIGSVDIKPDREGLQATENTKTVISQKIKEIEESIQETIIKEIETCKDIYSLKKSINTWKLNSSYNNQIVGNYTWKKHSLQEIMDLGSPLYKNIISNTITMNGNGSIKITDIYKPILYRTYDNIIINDYSRTNRDYNARIRNILTELNTNSALLLSGEEVNKIAELLGIKNECFISKATPLRATRNIPSYTRSNTINSNNVMKLTLNGNIITLVEKDIISNIKGGKEEAYIIGKRSNNKEIYTYYGSDYLVAIKNNPVNGIKTLWVITNSQLDKIKELQSKNNPKNCSTLKEIEQSIKDILLSESNIGVIKLLEQLQTESYSNYTVMLGSIENKVYLLNKIEGALKQTKTIKSPIQKIANEGNILTKSLILHKLGKLQIDTKHSKEDGLKYIEDLEKTINKYPMIKMYNPKNSIEDTDIADYIEIVDKCTKKLSQKT